MSYPTPRARVRSPTGKVAKTLSLCGQDGQDGQPGRTGETMNAYYVKDVSGQLPAHMPGWAIYRRTEAGTQLVCLCIDEAMARRIMAMLQAGDERADRG